MPLKFVFIVVVPPSNSFMSLSPNAPNISVPKFIHETASSLIGEVVKFLDEFELINVILLSSLNIILITISSPFFLPWLAAMITDSAKFFFLAGSLVVPRSLHIVVRFFTSTLPGSGLYNLSLCSFIFLSIWYELVSLNPNCFSISMSRLFLTTPNCSSVSCGSRRPIPFSFRYITLPPASDSTSVNV